MNTLDRVRRIVAREVEAEPGEIKVGDAIQRGLGADSLSMMQIAMAVEEEFDITVEDDELEKLVTVGDVVLAIEKKLTVAAA